MNKVSISYCGINLTSFSPEFKKTLPQGRYNFIDIPWNACCPAHGVLLVTKRQLDAIIENQGFGELKLQSVNPEGDDEGVTLRNIYAVKATPLWGNFYEDGDRKEGIYALEVQDERSVLAMNSTYPLRSINVQMSPWKGKTFLKATINSDTNKPYSLREMVDKMTANKQMSVDIPAPYADMAPWDIFIGGVPLLIAMDLLINAMNINQVFRFDPSSPENGKFGLASLSADIALVMNAHKKYRVFGGESIIFTTPNASIRYTSRTAQQFPFAGVSSECIRVPEDLNTGLLGGEWIEFVGLPTVRKSPDPSVVGEIDRKIGANRSHAPVHAIYHGFRKAFLSISLPFSLVTFDWAEFPTTHVHRTSSTPIRTILEGPHWRFIKDLPTRVSFSGDIQIEMPREGFWGVITECYPNGWAGVKETGNPTVTVPLPDAAVIHVWNGIEAWHEVGEVVPCIWVKGAYAILDKISGLGNFEFPIAANLSPDQAEPSMRSFCQDTSPPLTDLPGS